MMSNVTAEIVAIGTEILLGEITDTNSVYLARVLRDLGINLYFMTSVGDNVQRIASALQLALSRADVVITCGGLGPTVDDMTREAVALATQRGLTFYEHLYQQIEARFAMFRVKMSDNNKRQAYLPDYALPIENPVGTAPGFMVETDPHKVIISLPGVPREMKFLMNQTVVPYLRQHYQLGIIKTRILKTAGIGESSLDEMIGRDLLEGANPTIGLAAHHGVIDIRLGAKADDEPQANIMLDQLEQAVRQRVGEFIFGTDGETLEQILAQTLSARASQVVVIEAGIQDAVIRKLQSQSQYEGIMAYQQSFAHPHELASALGLEVGLSLRDLVSHVAEYYAKTHQVPTIVIACLPDINENNDQNPASAVAVHVEGQTQSRTYGFGGQSEVARDWLSRWAMSYVWRLIKP